MLQTPVQSAFSITIQSLSLTASRYSLADTKENQKPTIPKRVNLILEKISHYTPRDKLDLLFFACFRLNDLSVSVCSSAKFSRQSIS